MNMDHAITVADVVHWALWVGGIGLRLVALVALLAFLVNLMNPFSSGH